MCGRFAITLPPDAMVQMFDATPANDLPDVPNFNVCPTNSIFTVVSGDGVRHIGPMRWGFIPHWYKKPNDGPLLINARAETVAEKPAFRAACRERGAPRAGVLLHHLVVRTEEGLRFLPTRAHAGARPRLLGQRATPLACS